MLDTIKFLDIKFNESPYKDVARNKTIKVTEKEEKNVLDIYEKLDENEQKAFLNELYMLEKKIPNKEISNYKLKHNVVDFFTKGKRYYPWLALTLTSAIGFVAGNFIENEGLIKYGFGTMLASMPGTCLGMGRKFKSYKSEALATMPYSNFSKMVKEHKS